MTATLHDMATEYRICCRRCTNQTVSHGIDCSVDAAIDFWNREFGVPDEPSLPSGDFWLELVGFESYSLLVWAFPLPYERSGTGDFMMYETLNMMAYTFFQLVAGQELTGTIHQGNRPLYSLGGVRIHSPKASAVFKPEGTGPMSVAAVLEWANSEYLGGSGA